jgi:glycosyltransferase involved in cell wall biosynthesis
MSSDICLGTFGDTLQASLTNNNKIFEGFAMKKPIISGDSPAIPDILRYGNCIYLCERGNPKALAEAILTLKNDNDLCDQLGENGYRVLHEHFDVAHIGEAFAACIREVID